VVGSRIDSVQDVCGTNTQLTEFYCETGALREEYINCENGCKDGACKRDVTCEDSDNGKSYYCKGFALDALGTKFLDFCSNSSTLVEYYCNGGVMLSENKNCSGRCVDGKCQGEVCVDTTTFTCVDDAGMSYNVKDIATILKKNITQITDETCKALFNLIKTIN
jgi:hypothetical protein